MSPLLLIRYAPPGFAPARVQPTMPDVGLAVEFHTQHGPVRVVASQQTANGLLFLAGSAIVAAGLYVASDG